MMRGLEPVKGTKPGLAYSVMASFEDTAGNIEQYNINSNGMVAKLEMYTDSKGNSVSAWVSRSQDGRTTAAQNGSEFRARAAKADLSTTAGREALIAGFEMKEGRLPGSVFTLQATFVSVDGTIEQFNIGSSGMVEMMTTYDDGKGNTVSAWVSRSVDGSKTAAENASAFKAEAAKADITGIRGREALMRKFEKTMDRSSGSLFNIQASFTGVDGRTQQYRVGASGTIETAVSYTDAAGNKMSAWVGRGQDGSRSAYQNGQAFLQAALRADISTSEGREALVRSFKALANDRKTGFSLQAGFVGADGSIDQFRIGEGGLINMLATYDDGKGNSVNAWVSESRDGSGTAVSNVAKFMEKAVASDISTQKGRETLMRNFESASEGALRSSFSVQALFVGADGTSDNFQIGSSGLVQRMISVTDPATGATMNAWVGRSRDGKSSAVDNSERIKAAAEKDPTMLSDGNKRYAFMKQFETFGKAEGARYDFIASFNTPSGKTEQFMIDAEGRLRMMAAYSDGGNTVTAWISDSVDGKKTAVQNVARFEAAARRTGIASEGQLSQLMAEFKPDLSNAGSIVSLNMDFMGADGRVERYAIGTTKDASGRMNAYSVRNVFAADGSYHTSGTQYAYDGGKILLNRDMGADGRVLRDRSAFLDKDGNRTTQDLGYSYNADGSYSVTGTRWQHNGTVVQVAQTFNVDGKVLTDKSVMTDIDGNKTRMDLSYQHWGDGSYKVTGKQYNPDGTEIHVDKDFDANGRVTADWSSVYKDDEKISTSEEKYTYNADGSYTLNRMVYNHAENVEIKSSEKFDANGKSIEVSAVDVNHTGFWGFWNNFKDWFSSSTDYSQHGVIASIGIWCAKTIGGLVVRAVDGVVRGAWSIVKGVALCVWDVFYNGVVGAVVNFVYHVACAVGNIGKALYGLVTGDMDMAARGGNGIWKNLVCAVAGVFWGGLHTENGEWVDCPAWKSNYGLVKGAVWNGICKDLVYEAVIIGIGKCVVVDAVVGNIALTLNSAFNNSLFDTEVHSGFSTVSIGGCTAVGALIGTMIVPGLGTLIGAIVGAIVGAVIAGVVNVSGASDKLEKTVLAPNGMSITGVGKTIGSTITVFGAIGAAIGTVFGLGVGMPIGLAIGMVVGLIVGLAVSAAKLVRGNQPLTSESAIAHLFSYEVLSNMFDTSMGYMDSEGSAMGVMGTTGGLMGAAIGLYIGLAIVASMANPVAWLAVLVVAVSVAVVAALGTGVGVVTGLSIHASGNWQAFQHQSFSMSAQALTVMGVASFIGLEVPTDAHWISIAIGSIIGVGLSIFFSRAMNITGAATATSGGGILARISAQMTSLTANMIKAGGWRASVIINTGKAFMFVAGKIPMRASVATVVMLKVASAGQLMATQLLTFSAKGFFLGIASNVVMMAQAGVVLYMSAKAVIEPVLKGILGVDSMEEVISILKTLPGSGITEGLGKTILLNLAQFGQGTIIGAVTRTTIDNPMFIATFFIFGPIVQSLGAIAGSWVDIPIFGAPTGNAVGFGTAKGVFMVKDAIFGAIKRIVTVASEGARSVYEEGFKEPILSAILQAGGISASTAEYLVEFADLDGGFSSNISNTRRDNVQAGISQALQNVDLGGVSQEHAAILAEQLGIDMNTLGAMRDGTADQGAFRDLVKRLSNANLTDASVCGALAQIGLLGITRDIGQSIARNETLIYAVADARNGDMNGLQEMGVSISPDAASDALFDDMMYLAMTGQVSGATLADSMPIIQLSSSLMRGEIPSAKLAESLGLTQSDINMLARLASVTGIGGGILAATGLALFSQMGSGNISDVRVKFHQAVNGSVLFNLGSVKDMKLLVDIEDGSHSTLIQQLESAGIDSAITKAARVLAASGISAEQVGRALANAGNAMMASTGQADLVRFDRDSGTPVLDQAGINRLLAGSMINVMGRNVLDHVSVLSEFGVTKDTAPNLFKVLNATTKSPAIGQAVAMGLGRSMMEGTLSEANVTNTAALMVIRESAGDINSAAQLLSDIGLSGRQVRGLVNLVNRMNVFDVSISRDAGQTARSAAIGMMAAPASFNGLISSLKYSAARTVISSTTADTANKCIGFLKEVQGCRARTPILSA
ncbi:MAG: hypothetical protein PHH49_08345 [Candidatus Omnitrophica bacterium]|nr:hypothetical protein [Candidatus Omnitrophota bacterium]